MRKSDLIKILTELEGNPDIVLWNGMVGDWMDIDKRLIEGTLVRQTLDGYIESVQLEQCVDRKDWDYKLPESEIAELKQLYKRNIGWEDNGFVTDEDVEKKRFTQKRVVYINAKPRGVTFLDRLGSVEY
jgi:hypothetical protein